jgi:two-component system nitrate/nitrite response regulator NarL
MNEKISDVVKVIIVDDHRLFNDGLKAMLSPEPSIEVVAQIYDSREAKEAARKFSPDVILMDFNMPHIDGIELTKLMLADKSYYKILLLSMYNEERYIEVFRTIGAKGYLFKTASSEEVVQAIQDVHAGGLYFPQSDSKSNHANDNFLKKLKLSNRELEVIQLIKAGLKTKEIAEKLNISFYTAETHRKNIKLKVGLKGEAEFIKFIFEI